MLYEHSTTHALKNIIINVQTRLLQTYFNTDTHEHPADRIRVSPQRETMETSESVAEAAMLVLPRRRRHGKFRHIEMRAS